MDKPSQISRLQPLSDDDRYWLEKLIADVEAPEQRNYIQGFSPMRLDFMAKMLRRALDAPVSETRPTLTPLSDEERAARFPNHLERQVEAARSNDKNCTLAEALHNIRVRLFSRLTCSERETFDNALSFICAQDELKEEPAWMRTQSADRRPLTDDDIVRAIRDAGASDREWRELTREVGPYSITEPRPFVRRVIDLLCTHSATRSSEPTYQQGILDCIEYLGGCTFDLRDAPVVENVLALLRSFDQQGGYVKWRSSDSTVQKP